MTDASELLRLAGLCEAASGPDRELDKVIHAIRDPGHVAAMGAEAVRMEGEMRANGLWEARGHMVADHCNGSPRYTASLDAAVTLVPEDAYWRLGHDGDGADPSVFKAELYFPMRLRNEAMQVGMGDAPALALCAASLRAIALTQGQNT